MHTSGATLFDQQPLHEKKEIIVPVSKELKQKHFDEILKVKFAQFPTNTTIIFDFSEIIWIELDAAVWLISLLNKLKVNGNDIKIVLPDSSNLVWDFLIAWKFFDALEKCVDSPVNLFEPYQLQFIYSKSKYQPTPIGQRKIISDIGEELALPHKLLEINPINALNNGYSKGIIDYIKNFNEIAFATIRNICGWEDELTKEFVTYVVYEGLENSFLHGENTFSNVAIKTDFKNLTLVIGDNGKGIPTSLRETFLMKGQILKKDYSDKNDAFLLTYFTQPEMVKDSLLIDQASKKNIGSVGRQGNGLFYLKDFILRQGGKLRIRSGTAWVGFQNDKKGNEDIEPIDHLIQSPGTLLTIILPKTKLKT
ncbi:MAG TPA: hypothetical protein VJY62_11165 [Bacteroidia bacterium]|nr:hypothetical protein [Bacteroidia bacterium]